jgi:SAM-dependent methyltransferase
LYLVVPFDKREDKLMEGLAEREYLRQRLQPTPGDPLYLTLSDLLCGIRALVPCNASRVLDYGSGGSPYRPLFEHCIYHRADLSGENLDFEFGPDARLPPSVGGYDLVLSTQVLEHVEEPATYLRECYRVLRPDGRLLITTHGIFEEHGCPHDYWRWTTFGLQKIIETAGLKVEAIKKITTGPRAAVFLAEQQFENLQSNQGGLYGRLLSLGIQAIQRIGPRRLHIVSDVAFRKNRVVDAKEAGHASFIGIAILAIK